MDDKDINKVVEDIAKNKIVEKIVNKITRNESYDNLQDLIQDIYIQLLTKNTNKVIEMYNNNQLNFYISRIVVNNICSKTSPYHRTYRARLGDAFESLSLTEFNNIKENNKWTTL